SDVTSILKRVITNSICFGILAVIFLSLGFSALMAQSVSAPIRKLRASVEEIRNGNLALRVSVDREDELGMLEESFNHMLDEINQLMVNIDEEKHSLWLAETKSLNLQMNPHFLYNTLDLIKWSVKLNRPHEAEMLAVNLAKLLRKIMDIQEDLVSLSSELDLIDTFVALQNIHFNNELKLKYDIPEEMLHLQVPKLGLQPLVENAVVHGFKQKETDCRIQIIGKCEKEYLLITVRDNGTGMTQQELQAVLTSKGENGYHIGLRNVERRAKLYGDDSCGLFLDDAWEMGTAITLRLRKQRQNGI
ncbi:MAG: sensor histidine kinase, partial [Lachnospiraceae bacterium]|nr:sensor histidine kinase [Lachnospiraceae bacterium]